LSLGCLGAEAAPGSTEGLLDDSVAACVALPFSERTRRLLELSCMSSAQHSWMACLRLAQQSISGMDFLVFDGAIFPAELPGPARTIMEVDASVVAALGKRGGGLASAGVLLGRRLGNLFVALGLHPFDFGLFPAQNPDGSTAGYQLLAGAGSTLALGAYLGVMRVEVGAGVVGYYTTTASASYVDGSLSINLSGSRARGVRHSVMLRGGYGVFPSVQQVSPDSWQVLGGVWWPFAGAGYALEILH
jgi:hypothetical protein